MTKTTLAYSSITCQILTCLESYYDICKNWWEKCPDTYQLYLIFIYAAAEHSNHHSIANCSSCNAEFIVDRRARKNNAKCYFGCRKKQRNEKSRYRKIRQRAKKRKRKVNQNKPTTATTKPLINNVKAVKLNDICHACVILIVVNHPRLSFLQAKLFGIISFMSRSIKFAYPSPEKNIEFDEKQLWEQINELDSG